MMLRLLLASLFTSTAMGIKLNLRKIETLTSTDKGSGMDKPSFFWFGYSNGGTYEIEICNTGSCCRTGKLNTEDNNWELGQTDWFVASQINDCYKFDLDPAEETQLTLYHTGSNGGKLDSVNLHSWHSGSIISCPIETKLDHTTSVTVNCTFNELQENDSDESEWCNGSKYFCNMNFDQYLFPGAHNAGTGQSYGLLPCVSKNQDLNMTEQLEFGIRFFDVDIIYSTTLPGCAGLETGHGNMPDYGIYQCYGRVETMLLEAKAWMDEHTSEIIVLDFGGIEYSKDTVPALVQVIKNIFDGELQVRLNTDYKETGKWPTLKAAVQQNKRVFVFVRDHSVQPHKGIVEEIKLRRGERRTRMPGAALISSSYQAKNIGKDCSYVLDNVNKSCSRNDADFVKLSLFTAYFKSGVDCLWEMARYCNKLVNDSIQICNSLFPPSSETVDLQFAPNFLLLDYPNYQTDEDFNIVEICNKENHRRATLIDGYKVSL